MTNVDWKPYPETKPEFYEPVLVTLEYPDGSKSVAIDFLHRSPNPKITHCWTYESDEQEIIAWAKLPEPYRSETKDE